MRNLNFKILNNEKDIWKLYVTKQITFDDYFFIVEFCNQEKKDENNENNDNISDT